MASTLPATSPIVSPDKALSGHAIREAFLSFFEKELGTQHAHKRVQSASLVPANNPTVLLTPAGMLPFVPIFLGIEPPPTPPRAVSSQKCARVSGKASDLESVGRTLWHHTFFEMLGNFSFGDYFKEDIIPWAWQLVTEQLHLPPDRLLVTVFETDDEAWQIWHDKVGVPEDRIKRFGKKDNFWGPPGPTGPCGPCSEIYVDRGAHFETFDERYMEIWNLVFMEKFQDAEGNFSSLEKKNIDTGMGLERIAMVIQNAGNTFETDLLFPIVQEVAKLSKTPYGKSPETDVALKIVTDHLRCLCFAMADGVTPSNEGRGYVIRMLLRRAARYARKYLNLEKPFLHGLVESVVTPFGHAYPELPANQDRLKEIIEREEVRFHETLDRGLHGLDDMISAVKAQKKTVFPGADIFKLYDTFGFPVELTQDILEENGLTADMDGFETCMAEQKEMARSARQDKAIVDGQVFSHIVQRIKDTVGKTEFVGYDNLTSEAKILALVVDGQEVDKITETNQVFQAVLSQTPFYPEGGGQVGDRGSFIQDKGHHGLTVVVRDTQKVGDLIVHDCVFDNGGTISVGDTILAEVDGDTRLQTILHHTSTHLLQAALRKVLGDSVTQAGSRVAPDGARFDFTFNRAVTQAELDQVEALVNQWIRTEMPATVAYMPIDEAKAVGAIAMFDEKYGDEVRVVKYGPYSMELCGGTHVQHLGQIGLMKIVSEGAIASGVRRIELVAGEQAYRSFKQLEGYLGGAASIFKAPPQEVTSRIQKLQEDLKAKDKQLKAMAEKLALASVRDLATQPPQLNTPLVYGFCVEEVDGEGLRVMGEQFAQQVKNPHILILASTANGNPAFMVKVGDDLVKQGYQAGQLVKALAEFCGGKGGGKPSMAQAGGGDPSKIQDALAHVLMTISPSK